MLLSIMAQRFSALLGTRWCSSSFSTESGCMAFWPLRISKITAILMLDCLISVLRCCGSRNIYPRYKNSFGIDLVLMALVWWGSFASSHRRRFSWSYLCCPASHLLWWQRSSIQRIQGTICWRCRYFSWLLHRGHCAESRMAVRHDPSAYQLHNGKTGVFAWYGFQYAPSRKYRNGVARRKYHRPFPFWSHCMYLNSSSTRSNLTPGGWKLHTRCSKQASCQRYIPQSARHLWVGSLPALDSLLI